MLRKCKVGNPPRPAWFHGWFQFGNSDGGMDANGVVEFEDGTTDYYSPGYITFDEPPACKCQVGISETKSETSTLCCGRLGRCNFE